MNKKNIIIGVLSVIIVLLIGYILKQTFIDVPAIIKAVEHRSNNNNDGTCTDEYCTDDETNNDICTDEYCTDDETKNNELKKETQRVNFSSHLNNYLGDIIVTKNGDVYYIPTDDVVSNATGDILGEYKTYRIDEYVDMFGEVKEFKGYKLQLSNIEAAYSCYFGNGGNSGSMLFVSYDGYVSELTINLLDDNASKIDLTKNLSSYKDIVSVVRSYSDSGESVILIDKYGNKYRYNGTK